MPTGKTRAERLALKLRTRCFREFGGADYFIRDVKPNAGNIIVGTVSSDPRIAGGSYTFPITETDGVYPFKTIWTVYIHVSNNLDVFVEPSHGKAPKYILACALGE